MSDIEEWRAIPGYEGAYEVSDKGGVRSLTRLDTRGRLRRGKLMSPRKARSGHLAIALHAGSRRNFLVHHLVLMAFVGPRPDGLDGCHRNDIPDDNRVANLRWDTRSSNALDCVRNGGHHMANRTECPKGHPYTPENTYVKPSGSRCCRDCRRIYREEHREERRLKGREYMRQRRARARTEAAENPTRKAS
ncbi:NUMOD4 motif-containing HNH endonuclease [Mycobacterium sp. 48b]|uniref:NUMOD4 motif-containing HNH endonuclease n=1 Tax=Mycobacterium sp. 48b TaxID=3400426 RepID=UPI003AAD16D3